MTISVTVSVNGNYKCPVTYRQGEQEVTQVVSGRGHNGPHVLHIPFRHGPDVLTLSVGPEAQDDGEQAFDDDSGGQPHPPTGPGVPPGP